MSLSEMFGYDFMIRALIAALVTGLAAPTVGTFLVQRRLAEAQVFGLYDDPDQEAPAVVQPQKISRAQSSGQR